MTRSTYKTCAINILAYLLVLGLTAALAFEAFRLSDESRSDGILKPLTEVDDIALSPVRDGGRSLLVAASVEVLVFPPIEIHSPRAGVVTDSLNTVVLEPQPVPLIELDGRYVYSLPTSTPLYRPLLGGERGPDVAALAELLAEMSLLDSDDIDDEYSKVLRASFKQLEELLWPDNRPIGVVQLTDFIWQRPAYESGSRLSPVVEIGDMVSPGISVLATAASSSVQSANAALPTPELQWESARFTVSGDTTTVFEVVVDLDGNFEFIDATLPSESASALVQVGNLVGSDLSGGGSDRYVTLGTLELRLTRGLILVPPLSVLESPNGRPCIWIQTVSGPKSHDASIVRILPTGDVALLSVTVEAGADSQVVINPSRSAIATEACG